MSKRGKRYDTAIAEIDPESPYDPKEAVSITKRNATAKFDETVELHLRTGADPRHAEQMVRGIALLPHGVGKEIRTLVFCQGDTIESAKQAGADHVGNDDVMGKISKLGRILGRRGLMPNPRTGTVVSAEDIPRAIGEAKKGRVEFRLDKSALIHAPIGKASFDEDQLMENLTTLVDTILRGRPSGVKGQFLRSAFLTSTMGPSVPIDIAGIMSLRVE